MIIKDYNCTKSTITEFELIGNDELALSKAFSYLLSINFNIFTIFLKALGIKNLRSKKYYETRINTETTRPEGRTDIEIENDDFHIIIECKIAKNKLSRQKTQYNNVFKPNKIKILCFITEEIETELNINDDIRIIYFSWFDILNLIEKPEFIEDKLILSFKKLSENVLNMNNNNEILIQDLSINTEIELFEKYSLYRRNRTFGIAYYFAPYYTKTTGKPVGINQIKKILGVMTFNTQKHNLSSEDFKRFTDDEKLIENWIDGINKDKKNETLTYYFLGDGFKFKTPLLKDEGIQKGRGKNWIAAMIPRNRRLRFIDLLEHIQELK